MSHTPVSLLHDILLQTAITSPDKIALIDTVQTLSYQDLAGQVKHAASVLLARSLQPGERVAIYLNKSVEHVIALFAASLAGAVIVPVNALLKPHQVAHILQDSGARFLVTSADRRTGLAAMLADHADVDVVVDLDQPQGRGELHSLAKIEPQDPAAILYTSGSTGLPKGVVLSHQNLTLGAQSVKQYLDIQAHDRLLLVLPLHFDYGFNQLTTAFLAGASVVLMEYLFAKDVLRNVATYAITGLACVPPLLMQLAQLNWPPQTTLRYITNSGGHLPKPTVQHISQQLPQTALFLMYGLTECFRSTSLRPNQVLDKPGSVGQAIPNVCIHILRPDGSECDVDEVGELVHSGPLVALGYWQKPELTRQRFKPLPPLLARGASDLAVWSGDLAKRDSEGDLVILGREDEQIKVSGYRVSPTEVEKVLSEQVDVASALVFGVPHPTLGAGIVAVVTLKKLTEVAVLVQHCKTYLPNFMLPQAIYIDNTLPTTTTGKFDRAELKQRYQTLWAE